MTIILLPLAFLLIYAYLRLLPGRCEKPGAFIQAVLLFSFLVLISTEVLSLFNLCTYKGLAVFWAVFNFILIFIIAVKFRHRINEIFDFKKFRKIWNTDASGKIFWLIIMFLLSGIFIQGLIYPPNNWDSMTYHMARIVHWVQNSNVNYYPTNIIRQLNQPPFAEYFIAQLCILSKNDLWANFVQFFFLVSTLGVMAGIARELGLPASQQLLTLFLAVTIPEVILQSSNTQNDVVVSFFIASTVYYCLICYKEGFAVQYIFLAISIGLAILSKTIAYIYLTPVLLVFGLAVLLQALKNRQWKFIYKYLIIFVVVLLINGGFFYRNYTLSGNLFGTTQEEYHLYTNKEHTPSALASNITRNVALHYGVPVFSGVAENTVRMVHAWIGQKPDNPKTTFGYVKEFMVNPYGTHEDYGANIIQVSLILIIFISFVLFPRKIKKEILFYFLLIILMFLLFCFYLKWQPWHSRLHTPLFILVTPVMAYFLASFIPKKLFIIITFLMAVYAISVLTFNYSRPLCPIPPFTADVKILDDRFKKYFVNRNSAFLDYQAISGYLKVTGYINIGLKLGTDDWEYPLFCDVFNRPVKAIHIDVNNISKNIPQPDPEIDCIVSSEKRDELVYRNIKYYNFTPANSVLFLYKR
jgi:4-amino-4-deoxy-L-arabinose transferase-like glycosyltransferase